jgi:hypothetical protein
MGKLPLGGRKGCIKGHRYYTPDCEECNAVSKGHGTGRLNSGHNKLLQAQDLFGYKSIFWIVETYEGEVEGGASGDKEDIHKLLQRVKDEGMLPQACQRRKLKIGEFLDEYTKKSLRFSRRKDTGPYKAPPRKRGEALQIPENIPAISDLQFKQWPINSFDALCTHVRVEGPV